MTKIVRAKHRNQLGGFFQTFLVNFVNTDMIKFKPLPLAHISDDEIKDSLITFND